jgi:hypothetical protein
MRNKLGWMVLMMMVFGLGHASAQTTIPEGSFVRDSVDNTWLISGGTRSVVPIFQASDEEILAIPASNKWVSIISGGLVMLGNRPEWADEPETLRLTDDPPKVNIKLSDDEINTGTPLQVTLVGTDDVSMDWIEWEAEPESSDPAADDPVLVTVRRFDCDGGLTCTNTWTVTPTGHGRYVIVARARDKTGQRSDATSDLTVR